MLLCCTIKGVAMSRHVVGNSWLVSSLKQRRVEAITGASTRTKAFYTSATPSSRQKISSVSVVVQTSLNALGHYETNGTRVVSSETPLVVALNTQKAYQCLPHFRGGATLIKAHVTAHVRPPIALGTLRHVLLTPARSRIIYTANLCA